MRFVEWFVTREASIQMSHAEGERQTLPGISVVIPTTLRDSLPAAISCVLAQRYNGSIEIVVVVDRAREQCGIAEIALCGNADEVIFTGGGRGAGTARNLGIQSSSGELIAFLDDDDRWVTDKLSKQVSLLEDLTTDQGAGARGELVISSRLFNTRGDDEAHDTVPIPSRLRSTSETVEDYLFKSRPPTSGRPTLPTSTLLVSKELALAIPWKSDLKRHQDWDWLIRLQKQGGAQVNQHPEALMIYNVGSVGSISGSPDWRSSLEWVTSVSDDWAKRTRADFVVAQPLRYALQARDPAGVAACFRSLWRIRRMPSLRATAVGLAGLLSRSLFNKALTRRIPS